MNPDNLSDNRLQELLMVPGLWVTARSAGPASVVPQVDMRASTKTQTISRRCAAQFSVSRQPHSAIDRLIDLWGTDGRQLGGEGKCMFAPKATTKLLLSSSPLHKIKDVLVSWKRSRDASPEICKYRNSSTQLEGRQRSTIIAHNPNHEAYFNQNKTSNLHIAVEGRWGQILMSNINDDQQYIWFNLLHSTKAPSRRGGSLTLLARFPPL